MEAPAAAAQDGRSMREEGEMEEEGQRLDVPGVDPFLVEALQNPRHRLTVLRMELDIQRFMQNSDQHQFEFQHLPTSYLRCAAHRVAQHYGLQTMALENGVDGFYSRVVARKVPESRFPASYLSDIPVKLPESGKTEPVKIVIRARPNEGSSDAIKMEEGKILARTVEERKEEYDRARARIFSAPSSPESERPPEQEYERIVSLVEEHEKNGPKDGALKVAIFRDKEKDRSDPDYDRSYDRYARGVIPCHDLNLGACNLGHSPFLPYEPGFHQFLQFPRNTVSYMPSNIMTPNSAAGCGQPLADAFYMQWAAPAMYAHSYDQFRHVVYPAPAYQQPLSFEHWRNI